MRPLELLLSLANVVTFIGMAMPHDRAATWRRYSPSIALLTTLLGVALEGPRWQLAPAYSLTGIFFLLWLSSATPGKNVPNQGLRKDRLFTGLTIVLGSLAVVFSLTVPVLLPVFEFPHPGGSYEIGTLTYHWRDENRREVFSTDSSVHRELMAQVWYPARKGTASLPGPYLRESDAVATALARLHNFPDFLLKHLRYVTTHASEHVPVAGDEPRYPVLIFIEGLTGYRQMNNFQVEELVSHGYIVVGLDQPGDAATVVFPDGHQIAGLSKTEMDPLTQQSANPGTTPPQLNGQEFKDGIIPYFAQDVRFALDRLDSLNTADPNNILTTKLDLDRTGIFGVSFGGIVAAEACLNETRIKACMVMDVLMSADVVRHGLKQPCMWITRDAGTMRLERKTAGGWTEADIEQTQTTMRSVYQSLAGEGYFVQVPGMYHIDLTDLSCLSPIFPAIGFSGPIGSQRAHAIINGYSVAFFDKHLKGAFPPLLDERAGQHPEVIFERRRR